MNQKCFWVSGTVVEISDYVNDLISNGWKIVSVNAVSSGPSSMTAIVVGEVPVLNLTFKKK
jgi:hypothetical protein